MEPFIFLAILALIAFLSYACRDCGHKSIVRTNHTRLHYSSRR